MFTIETHSGLVFDFSKATEPGQISLEDVAWGLAGEGRFANQCNAGYYVGQHSCLVAELVEIPWLKFPALVHDGPEAYTGDMPSPLKAWLRQFTDAMDVLQDDIQEAVHGAFGIKKLTIDEKAIIKRADLQALTLERRLVMPTSNHVWSSDVKIPEGRVFDCALYPWSPEQCRWEFKTAFWKYEKIYKRWLEENRNE